MGEKRSLSRMSLGKKSRHGEGSKPVATTTAAISSMRPAPFDNTAVLPSSASTLPFERVIKPDRTKSQYQSLTARYGGSVLVSSSTRNSGEKAAWLLPSAFS